MSGRTIDSFSPQNSPAQTAATTGFESQSGTSTVTAQASETGMVASGATVELTTAYSGTVTFEGTTGKLILDHSTAFTGEIINFTGNGNGANSDLIDLKDVTFGTGTTNSYSGTSTGGLLTVGDAAHDTASLLLAGNYLNSTFSLSSDGNGGTLVVDPPVTQSAAQDTFFFGHLHSPERTLDVSPQNGAGYSQSATVNGENADSGPGATDWHTAPAHLLSTAAGAGNDNFVFKSGLGNGGVANATDANTFELDHAVSTDNPRTFHTLLNETQASQPHSQFQPANDTHNLAINFSLHDNPTAETIVVPDPHANGFAFHPPIIG